MANPMKNWIPQFLSNKWSGFLMLIKIILKWEKSFQKHLFVGILGISVFWKSVSQERNSILQKSLKTCFHL